MTSITDGRRTKLGHLPFRRDEHLCSAVYGTSAGRVKNRVLYYNAGPNVGVIVGCKKIGSEIAQCIFLYNLLKIDLLINMLIKK